MTDSLDWADVEACAEAAAGNHRKFVCFAWHERPEDDEDWMIAYTSNRDSELLTQSNEDAVKAELEPFTEGEEPEVAWESHDHWAVGHVDGPVIRVYRRRGGEKVITEAFRKFCEINERLSDYPVLDEEDWSRREYEDTLTNIEQEGRRLVKEGAPEDWAGRVFSWFWEHEQRAVEPRDGWGGYPTGEQMLKALAALDLLDWEPAGEGEWGYDDITDGELLAETETEKTVSDIWLYKKQAYRITFDKGTVTIEVKA